MASPKCFLNSDPLSVSTKENGNGKIFRTISKNSSAAFEAWDVVPNAKPNRVYRSMNVMTYLLEPSICSSNVSKATQCPG